MDKFEILKYIFKSKDGASWNEVSEMLNEYEKENVSKFMTWLYDVWHRKRFATPPMLVKMYFEEQQPQLPDTAKAGGQKTLKTVEQHEPRLNEQIGELGKGYKFVCKMYYPYGLSCYDNFYTKEELTSELKELVEKVKLQEDNLQSKLTEVKKLAYQIFAGYKIRKFLKQL